MHPQNPYYPPPPGYWQPPPPAQPWQPAASIIAGAVTAIGLLIALFTQVSLASGTGTVWMGVAMAIIGAVAAWAIPGTPTWLRVVLTIAACVAIAGGIYDEHQLDQRREQLQQIFDSLP